MLDFHGCLWFLRAVGRNRFIAPLLSRAGRPRSTEACLRKGAIKRLRPTAWWFLSMMTDVPNSAIAGDLAAAALGRLPIGVRRFSTGSHHYVFEATFEDRTPVVVRIAAEHSRAAMAGALKVSRLLRPQGV